MVLDIYDVRSFHTEFHIVVSFLHGVPAYSVTMLCSLLNSDHVLCIAVWCGCESDQ